MRIGILGDTHDHRELTLAALAAFRAAGVTRLFHTGDITRPETVRLFAGFDVTFVRGNNDVALAALAAALQAIGAPGRLPLTWTGRLAGRRLAMTHGMPREPYAQLVASGRYDYVFHGHSHRRRDKRVGRTRVINPGALTGKREYMRSIAILDLVEDELQFELV
jgi:putative phosphoesterase